LDSCVIDACRLSIWRLLPMMIANPLKLEIA